MIAITIKNNVNANMKYVDFLQTVICAQNLIGNRITSSCNQCRFYRVIRVKQEITQLYIIIENVVNKNLISKLQTFRLVKTSNILFVFVYIFKCVV